MAKHKDVRFVCDRCGYEEILLESECHGIDLPQQWWNIRASVGPNTTKFRDLCPTCGEEVMDKIIDQNKGPGS